ncbi:MAG TPA: hypothetical protein VH414_12940 [Lichenihabitans sp.]|nr:hypothetical protein [Lichenihabitans sp.]
MTKSVPWNSKDGGGEPRRATAAASPTGSSVEDWLDAMIADHMSSSSRNGGTMAERLAQKAARTAAPAVRLEVDRYLAATGTDGMALPQTYMAAAVPAADDLRNGTALRSISDRLTRFEQQSFRPTAEDPDAPPSGPPARAPRSLSVRDAIAEIARRQAALDTPSGVEPAAPSAAAASTPAELGLSRQSIGALGEAVSALEARLAGSRGRAAASTRRRGSAAASPGAGAGESRPRAGAPVDDDTDAAFQALSRDLRDAMANIEARDVAVARGGEAPPRSTYPPEGEQLLGDIRSLLDRFRPGSTLDSLDRRMQDLSERLEQRFDSPASLSLIESLSHRVEDMHASLKASAPAPDMRQIETLMRGVASRIEDARDASTDIQALEGMVRHLTEKVEATRLPFDARAVSGLESQIERLAERLERSEASLSSLDAVERSLSELFTQIEQTRHATIDAAETAARTAARDTLRAAMQQTTAGPRSPEGASLAVEKVGQDVVDLRMQHEAAERRTQATLAGLHQTMEKLLGHLEGLDVAGRRSGERPLAPPSAEPIEAEPDLRSRGRQAAFDDPPPVEPRRESREARAADVVVDPLDSLIEPRAGRGRARPPEGDAAARMPRAGGAAVASPGSVQAEGPANFIAAARRAAQAAQASAAEAHVSRRGRARPDGAPKSKFSALKTLDQAKAYLAARRRPVLLSLAGLVLLLGALEIVKVGMEPSSKAEVPIASSAPPVPASADAGRKIADAAPAGRADDISPLTAAPRPGAAQAPPVVVAPDTSSAAPTIVAPAVDAPGDSAADKPPLQARPGNPFLAGLANGVAGLPEGLKSLADAGDAAAEYEVGLRLAEGRSVARDPKAAADWLQKAAAQGLAPAQYRLGSAYEKGIGVARDPAMAMTLYGRAAEAGNIRAMHNLAVMAAEGAVGKPDYAKAATWFGKAAELGVRDSQFNLAILYARGLGIEQNLGKSYLWFAVAAAQGDQDAAKKRDDVGVRLDAKALDAAKAAVAAFRPETPIAAANEVAPPPGGWDASAPAKAAPLGRKVTLPKGEMM